MRFDTIIPGSTIVTASDTFKADIGILNGRITALADDLGNASEIDDPPAAGECGTLGHQPGSASSLGRRTRL